LQIDAVAALFDKAAVFQLLNNLTEYPRSIDKNFLGTDLNTYLNISKKDHS